MRVSGKYCSYFSTKTYVVDSFEAPERYFSTKTYVVGTH